MRRDRFVPAYKARLAERARRRHQAAVDRVVMAGLLMPATLHAAAACLLDAVLNALASFWRKLPPRPGKRRSKWVPPLPIGPAPTVPYGKTEEERERLRQLASRLRSAAPTPSLTPLAAVAADEAPLTRAEVLELFRVHEQRLVEWLRRHGVGL